MKFLSHIKRNKNNEIISEKKIVEHISNIHKIIEQGYAPNQNGVNALISEVVKLHDLGKYTKFFQDYLRTNIEHPHNYHFHTLIGACTFFNYLSTEDRQKALIGYFVIYHHHSNLGNITRCFPEERINQINKRLKNQYLDIISNLKKINNEIGLNLNENLLASKSQYLLDDCDDMQDQANIKNYFQINYLFSLLIEADKLDASETKVYHRMPLSPSKVDKDKGLPNQVWDEKVNNFSHLSQNELRNLVRKRVIDKLSEEGITNQKIFTLTGPTGIGKTLTALDFALKLRAIIREKQGREAQIIYALPFINIIEQADSVYRKLFGDDEARILSHYQYADALSQQDDKYNDDGKGYDQKVMSLDTWQCDIVITTFVQFLQTLIGNRNRLLKKFNHYAGSIIILDEVQTIALKQLPLVGASLYYLAKFLDSTIVLMTATKPKVFELANEKILLKEAEKAIPVELLGTEEDVTKVFRSFNRTMLCPRIKEPIKDQTDFIENYLKEYWQQDKSCLIVVNTVKLSIDVFYSIQAYFKDKKIKNPLYYLSTNVIPAVREQLINQIKEDIQSTKKRKGLMPILVSTQCVEAGVDLDFDMAFRDLAPIDSIIQVAGRVNREYNRAFVGEVYIIDFGKCGRIYGPMTEGTIRNSIEFFTDINPVIEEKNYLNLVTYYYNNICERNDDGFGYSLNFFNSMKELNYDGSEWSVSKFQVIDNGFKTCSIFIEFDEKAKRAKEMYDKLISKDCNREDFEPFKRDFHQHIIAVPDYLAKVKELKSYQSSEILFVYNDQLKYFYDSETGFRRDTPEESFVTIL
ncbi:MAG: CRISPR-associated helicase Cas3' [Paludibacter sp.]|nr:CRISPR-associated helicase Cas3' [Paludibacter sp.]